MSNNFVQLVRSMATEDLIKRDPFAFSVLSMIAKRANREYDPNTGLYPCEAMIGRPEFTMFRNSMSDTNFRSALKRLERHGHITTKATKQGTIAKLQTKSIYDLNLPSNQPTNQHETNQQATNNQPTSDQQPTTNKNKKEKNKKEKEYNPDQIISVINFRNENTKASLGKILDSVFGLYPGNANNGDRNDVATFLVDNPDYPFCIAVDREVEQHKNNGYSRSMKTFISDPPDKAQVMGWFERQKVEE